MGLHYHSLLSIQLFSLLQRRGADAHTFTDWMTEAG